MPSVRNAARMLIPVALLVSASSHAADSEWHFKVTNDSSSKIVGLELSEDKKPWGPFDIGDFCKDLDNPIVFSG